MDGILSSFLILLSSYISPKSTDVSVARCHFPLKDLSHLLSYLKLSPKVKLQDPTVTTSLAPTGQDLRNIDFCRKSQLIGSFKHFETHGSNLRTFSTLPTSQRFNTDVVVVHQHPPRNGMMVIVKPKMEVALGKSFLVGLMAPKPPLLVEPKFHATMEKRPCLQQKIPSLWEFEGFCVEVFWLSHAVMSSLQM